MLRLADAGRVPAGEAVDVSKILAFVAENPLVGVIVGCEIGFWVVLLAGLVARYLLRRRRLGAVLLMCVPLVDVVLLVAAAFDLRGGGTADATHGLGAVYLGMSVAFGHSMVRWADERFAYRFAGGPPPRKPPKYGAAKVRREWREWGKFALGWVIACGLMLLAIAAVGAPERTEALWGFIGSLSLILGIWFVVGPLWTTLSPPRARPPCP